MSAQPDATRLSMSWSLVRQHFSCGSETFFHDGPVPTDPSHDCAHLLIAASGNMLWNPTGEKKIVQLAEFNAVFLEHLMDAVYASTTGAVQPQSVITRASTYIKWFVEEYFIPFPVSALEACKSFCSQLDAQAIVRLSPYFFNLKRDEMSGRRPFRQKQTDLEFAADDCPVADAQVVELQAILSDKLRRLPAEWGIQ